MSEPTDQDLDNARVRAAIAARMDEEYRQAQLLAFGALGPGWTPWMKLVLIDADHRTGNTEPIAVVFKVYRGEQRLSENSAYLRRMPDGTVRTADSYEPLFGEMLTQKHPTRTVEVKGEQVRVGRWELCWQALDLYKPKSADALAAARAKRQERAVEKEADDNPLFSDQIRTGEWRPEKKPRGR